MDELFAHRRRDRDAVDPDQDAAPDEAAPDKGATPPPDADHDADHDVDRVDGGVTSGEGTSPPAPPPPPDDATPWPSWVRTPPPPPPAPEQVAGPPPPGPDESVHGESTGPDPVADDPEPVELDTPRVPEDVDQGSDLDADVGDADDRVDWRAELAADDPDATMVLPLSGRDGVRHGDDSPRAVWDTGTIRRWDPTMSDGVRTADDAMHRPHRLDDRSDVDVSRRGDDGGGRWYEIPLMILTALTLAFLLRTFVVQVFYIPSGSMIPTMEINDRIAVEKLSYLARDPARGEVVVFAGDDPLAGASVESTQERVLTGVGQFLGVVPVDAKDFVKRVIGLPGDTVVLDGGVVTVNGVELDEPYALLDQDNGEWTVPADQLFVLGDNRGNSGDSRSSLGYVPIDDVVGRAVVTLWPFDRAGSIPGEDHDVAVDAGS